MNQTCAAPERSHQQKAKTAATGTSSSGSSHGRENNGPVQSRATADQSSPVTGSSAPVRSSQGQVIIARTALMRCIFCTANFDLARSPEIDTEDAKGATERSGKDELAVVGASIIGSNATRRVLKEPVGDVFAAAWAKIIRDSWGARFCKCPSCDQLREMRGRLRKCCNGEMQERC